MGRADLRPKLITLAKGMDFAASEERILVEVLGLSGFEIFGLDWEIPVGAQIRVRLFQANRAAGPYAQWTVPDLAGGNSTNEVTLTTALDGTSLRLTPSMFGQVRLKNMVAAPVTIPWIGALLV